MHGTAHMGQHLQQQQASESGAAQRRAGSLQSWPYPAHEQTSVHSDGIADGASNLEVPHEGVTNVIISHRLGLGLSSEQVLAALGHHVLGRQAFDRDLPAICCATGSDLLQELRQTIVQMFGNSLAHTSIC